MTVYLDVRSKLDVAAAQLAAREATAIFTRAGDEMSRGLGASLSRAFGVLDTAGARREMELLQNEYRRTADVEAASAARITKSMGEVEVAQRRLAEMTARYGDGSAKAAAANVALADSHARAAKAQRDHVDAMVGTEGAAAALASTTGKAGESASRAGQLFNAAGVIGVAGFGAALFETGDKAASFQQQMIRLQASAGETSQNIKTVSDGILQLAGQVGYSTSDLSNAMYTVEKAGFRGADAVKVLTASAQLAKAENADLGEVVGGVTTNLNDYNIGVDGAANAASKMNVAVGMAKTNLQEFSGALHSVDPIAMTAGISMDQVMGALARLTQSGMSADQASQNLAQTMRNFVGPNAQMRDALGKIGLSAGDLQKQLGDPNVGLNGVLGQVAGRIRELGGPNGQVAIDTFYKNADASKALAASYDALSPKAKAMADQLNAGTFTDFKGLRLEKENEPALAQWDSARKKVDGLSSNLRKLQPQLETILQLFKETSGGAETLNVLSQLYGNPEDAQKTADATKAIGQAHADAKGQVAGFADTMEGAKAKMDAARSAFGAAEAEIGNAFIPIMTAAANVAKDVGDVMSKHPGIAHAVIDALGLLGGAWLTIKGIGIVETILAPVTAGLGAMAEAEGVAATAAGGLSTALGFLGPIAAGLALGPTVGKKIEGLANSSNWLNDNVRNPVRGLFGGAPIPDQKAGGGALNAPGPKGKDSALFWGAAGEHVLTAGDVDAMGGHSAVHSFRNALHRASGGALGPDVQAAEAMSGTPYSQGARNDCSGMVGRIVEAATGQGGALPSTRNMGEWLQARGFVPGIGGQGTLSVGWYNHGSGPNDGHTAMTLSDGENAESGGSHGNFLLGGNVGAASGQFDHHMYLPNLYGEGQGGGGGGGGAAGGGGGGGGGRVVNQQKVAAAQESVTHLQNEIKNLEERKATMKSTATQAEKDRLDEELRHEHQLLDEANGRLEKAQEGDPARGGGKGGRSGSPFMPVPFSGKISGGSAGEMAGSFVTMMFDGLADAIAGPIETAIGNAMGFDPSQPSGGLLGMLDGANSAPSRLGSSYAASGPGRIAQGGGFGAASSPGDIGADRPGGAQDIGASSGQGERSNYSAPTAGGSGNAGVSPSGGGLAGTQRTSAPGAPSVVHSPGSSATAAPAPTAAESGGLAPGWTNASGFSHQIVGSNGLPGFAGQAPAGAGTPGVPNLGSMFMPGYTGKSPNYMPYFGDPIGHFSGGTGEVGPSGTDTVPAWLTPGEMVIPVDQAQQWRQAQYFAQGESVVTPAADNTTPPPAPPPPPAPSSSSAQQGESPTGQGKTGGTGESPTGPGKEEDPSQQPSANTGGGVGGSGAGSKGLGLSGGGLIGFAEQSAVGAAQAAATGLGYDGSGAATGAAAAIASQAAQIGIQELNRTIAYGGQLAGIGVQGAISSLTLQDSPLSDFGNTIPGKLLTGISGATPSKPPSAGNTQAPLASQSQGGSGGSTSNTDNSMQVHGDINVQAPDAQILQQQLAAQKSMQNMNQLSNPSPQGPG